MRCGRVGAVVRVREEFRGLYVELDLGHHQDGNNRSQIDPCPEVKVVIRWHRLAPTARLTKVLRTGPDHK